MAPKIKRNKYLILDLKWSKIILDKQKLNNYISYNIPETEAKEEQLELECK